MSGLAKAWELGSPKARQSLLSSNSAGGGRKLPHWPPPGGSRNLQRGSPVGHAGMGEGREREVCLCSFREYEQLLEGKSAKEGHGALIGAQKLRERASNMSQLSFSLCDQGQSCKPRGRGMLSIIYGV